MQIMKLTQAILVALDLNGEAITVPRGQVLTFHSDLRDWRHVRVLWKDRSLTISRGAWDHCAAVSPEGTASFDRTGLRQFR